MTLSLPRGPAAVIGLNFAGLDQGSLPGTTAAFTPDAAGAAGPTHYAQFVNGGFATYDKVGGARASMIGDQQFWLNAGLDAAVLAPGVARPRLLYDLPSGRWFAVQRTGHDVDNSILLAVSTGVDPDPLPGNWRATVIPGNPGAPGGTGQRTTYRFVDFPTLGLDANGVYVTTLNAAASAGGMDNSNSLFSLPKTDLIAAEGPSLANLSAFHGTTDNYSALGFEMQPAVDFAPQKRQQAPVFAVNYEMFGAINRTDILRATGANAALSPTSVITVQDTDFPTSPRQPDGTGHPDAPSGLAPLDDRIASTVYQVGDLVYLAHAIGAPAGAAEHSVVRWTVLRVDGEFTEVVQEGTIEDPGFDFFTPSIAANPDGDVVIGYNRSGPGRGGEINAFVSIGTTDDSGAITFDRPHQVSFSMVGAYHNTLDPDGWGEYGSMTVDPTNPRVFWLTQPVPRDSGTWGTQVVQVIVPEPAATGILAASGAVASGLCSRRRHRAGFIPARHRR